MMKKTILILILIFICSIAFSISYTADEIKAIQTKINNGIKPTEGELVKLIAYLNDEIIRLKEENLNLIDSSIKDKQDKIDYLTKEIEYFEKEKQIWFKLLNDKENEIQERELKIKDLERQIKSNSPSNSIGKNFFFEINLKGGYNFLYMKPEISLSFNVKYFFNAYFGVFIEPDLNYNFEKVGSNLKCGLFLTF